MANEKEAIKKLLTIVAKQQRIITKLAQSADPFAASGLPGDPLDPTLPGDKPAAPAAAKPAPASTPAAPAKSGGLDPAIKAKLDSANMPQLKGSLLVTPTGSGLKIDFNADRVKERPTELKAKLEKAVGPISEIMGHMNPAWKANY
jgi:hypothetical protein